MRLVPVTLHVAADDGAVERLDSALLIDREHDGVSGRIEIEADDMTSAARNANVKSKLILYLPAVL